MENIESKDNSSTMLVDIITTAIQIPGVKIN